MKNLIFEKHEDKPIIETQRLIHSGKLLDNNQRLSDLNLNADENGSSIIHLVISRVAPPKPPTPEPVPVVEPVPEPAVEPPPAVENILRREPVVEAEPPTQTPPTAQPQNSVDQDDDSWQTDELKQYFKHWDLSIRCHQLNEKHKHLGLVFLNFSIYRGTTLEFYIR